MINSDIKGGHYGNGKDQSHKRHAHRRRDPHEPGGKGSYREAFRQWVLYLCGNKRGIAVLRFDDAQSRPEQDRRRDQHRLGGIIWQRKSLNVSSAGPRIRSGYTSPATMRVKRRSSAHDVSLCSFTGNIELTKDDGRSRGATSLAMTRDATSSPVVLRLSSVVSLPSSVVTRPSSVLSR